MHRWNSIATQVIALIIMIGSAHAFDDSLYPDLKGQWTRATPDTSFDPSKPPGRGQQAPLTPEYQAIFEANLREREAGVPPTWPGRTCLPPGMPATMTAYEPMEIIVMPRTTFIRIDYIRETRRRIFTDGRAWPKEVEPGFDGYSIGKWIDEDGDGKFDVLEAETRTFSGPRAFDLSGIPLHEDNETVIKERIYLDKANPNKMYDEITVIDSALTKPYVKMQTGFRNPDPRPIWKSDVCSEFNTHVRIGTENYYLSADGKLMPAKKNQAPPDLSYFQRTQ
jgi:hypothetical protein